MTTQEAADILKVHRSRVLHWIRDGRLQATKRGRDWWLEPEEVARFAALPREPGWKAGRSRKQGG